MRHVQVGVRSFDLSILRAALVSSFAAALPRLPGKPPNATFWPYADPATGEKRMCVKTVAPVRSGEELLVDYGSQYFEQERSDSDADSDSASDYEKEARRGRQGRRPHRDRQRGGRATREGRLRTGVRPRS